MKTLKQHNDEIEQIAKKIKQYSELGTAQKLRFFHGRTHSTRPQTDKNYTYINTSRLNGVIEVNSEQRYALVEPNVSMDKLVEKTLKYGLLPQVVPEFPGITCGGAVNGAALESSSYKYGQFSDTCEEYEIVLGNGEVVYVSAEKNKSLFYGISGAYGSLGLLSLIKIRLIPSSKYVHAAFHPMKSYEKTLKFIEKQIQKGEVDYIEGIIFHPRHAVVVTGKRVNFATLPIKTYTKPFNPWFYEHVMEIAKQKNIYEELIPMKDYLFRYDRGAFWMGEFAFPLLRIPSNKFTKFLLNPFMSTRRLFDVLHSFNAGRVFVQDFYCPLDKSTKILKYNEKNLGIFPIWLCPVKPAKSPQKLSPHYISNKMLLDIGIWGKTYKYLHDVLAVNKEFESFVKKNNGRKMLYACAYYTQKEFWSIYDKKWYGVLRKKYHADKAFPDIWEKVYVSGKYKFSYWKGLLKILMGKRYRYLGFGK